MQVKIILSPKIRFLKNKNFQKIILRKNKIRTLLETNEKVFHNLQQHGHLTTLYPSPLTKREYCFKFYNM